MRRKNRRRSASEEGLDTKKMLYITGSVLALAIIAFVITFILYSNKLNENTTNLSRLDTDSIGSIKAEETSTSYGKTVNEMQNEVISNTSEDSNVEDVTETSSSDTTKIAINTSNSKFQGAPGSMDLLPGKERCKFCSSDHRKGPALTPLIVSL